MLDVALVIAVEEPCCGLSQVVLADPLTAQRTESLRFGCPAIHQDEFHVRLPMRSRSFSFAMNGHACPVLIDLGVAPVVLRISTGQDAALMNGRRASRADVILAPGSRGRIRE